MHPILRGMVFCTACCHDSQDVDLAYELNPKISRMQVLTIMEKRGTRHTRRAASAAAHSNAKAGPSPELESAAEAASAAAAERAT